MRTPAATSAVRLLFAGAHRKQSLGRPRLPVKIGVRENYLRNFFPGVPHLAAACAAARRPDRFCLDHGPDLPRLDYSERGSRDAASGPGAAASSGGVGHDWAGVRARGLCLSTRPAFAAALARAARTDAARRLRSSLLPRLQNAGS